MTTYGGQHAQDPVPEGRPPSRLSCCLCRRAIPPAQEVFALDSEWQRRFPMMVGVLACEECLLETEWTCRDETGAYVSGHIPATGQAPADQDLDSWSHLPDQGTQAAMTQRYPDAALRQSAEDSPGPATTRGHTSIDLTEQRTELMGLIDAWQTTRPSRARTAR